MIITEFRVTELLRCVHNGISCYSVITISCYSVISCPAGTEVPSTSLTGSARAETRALTTASNDPTVTSLSLSLLFAK